MHKYDTLQHDLKAMGLKGDEIVLVHASVKAIGDVEGRANTVIDALVDYFQEGALLIPTHTWATITEEHPIYDPSIEPACVGLLPNLFLRYPGVVRSLHPTHSVGAIGKKAKAYIQNEDNLSTPTPKEGVYGRLKEEHGIILLIGVGLDRNTTIHAIEERMQVPNRLTEKPIEMTIVTQEGPIKRHFYKHFNKQFPHLSENYTRIHDYLLTHNVMTAHRFGDALVYKMEASRLSSVIEELLNEDIRLFDTKEVFISKK